jgi:hypothetical protein
MLIVPILIGRLGTRQSPQGASPPSEIVGESPLRAASGRRSRSLGYPPSLFRSLGLVPLAGLEPARPHGHLILSQARLPIPPQGQRAAIIMHDAEKWKAVFGEACPRAGPEESYTKPKARAQSLFRPPRVPVGRPHGVVGRHRHRARLCEGRGGQQGREQGNRIGGWPGITSL